jgi:Activator of Hsp90 ATPase homolog 1-like protein
MNLTQHTRRGFSIRLAVILPMAAIAQTSIGQSSAQSDRLGISHTSESIHQEVVFKATPKRIYEALTDEKQFKQVMDFVMKGALTQISREVGGPFSLFGGVILGRNIELVPDERIVQA